MSDEDSCRKKKCWTCIGDEILSERFCNILAMKWMRLFFFLSIWAHSSFLLAQQASCVRAIYPCNGNAQDVSGNGFHGTSVAVAPTTDRFGRPGQACQFNGSNSYINLGNQVANGIRSISMWFKPDETINCQLQQPLSLLVRNTPEQVSEIALMFTPWEPYDAGNCLFGRRLGIDTFNVASDRARWDAGVWHHIVVTISETAGMKMYVDNVLQSISNQSTDATPNSSFPISLGRWGNMNMRYFKGAIDDVRFYTCALTQEEVDAIYQEPICGRYSAATIQGVSGNAGIDPDGTILFHPGACLTFEVSMASAALSYVLEPATHTGCTAPGSQASELIPTPNTVFLSACLDSCLRGNTLELVAVSDDPVCLGYSDTLQLKARALVTTISDLPNAFSPNGDGQGDVFFIDQSYWGCRLFQKIAIYNRWGAQVFESEDVDFSWDGKGVPPGVYYYSVLFDDGSTLQSTITLLR
jgi:gliding motility-associated-like protein